jgi:hypothetical protein
MNSCHTSLKDLAIARRMLLAQSIAAACQANKVKDIHTQHMRCECTTAVDSRAEQLTDMHSAAVPMYIAYASITVIQERDMRPAELDWRGASASC